MSSNNNDDDDDNNIVIIILIIIVIVIIIIIRIKLCIYRSFVVVGWRWRFFCEVGSWC